MARIDERYGRIICGGNLAVLPQLPGESVHCCVTSPPYFGLRDYGHEEQIGLERTPQEYVAKMVEVFREVRRVLRPDGTLWLNIGDSYARLQPDNVPQSKNKRVVPPKRHDRIKNAGMKAKDLIGIPWMVAFALRADGWYLRQDIIWAKPNPMPGSMSDRCTTAHEYVFLLTKKARYFCDMEAIKEPATRGAAGSTFTKGKTGMNGKGRVSSKERVDAEDRNKRSVWSIPTRPFKGAHFAVMPEALVVNCVKAGTSLKGCCPKCGAQIARVVERERVATRPGDDTKVKGTEAATHGNRDPERHVTTTRTVGWEPSCGCKRREPVPCVVLDPFSGAGTVAAVAASMNRKFVGIELNPEYAAMSEKRVIAAIQNRGFGVR